MNAITTAHQSTAIRPVLIPQTFDQLVRFSEMAAATDMVPKDFRNKPGSIMLAVQMGSELGLSPMQSINSIAVINGRPGVWGDGLIGICRQSPLCQDIVETFEGQGDDRAAICVATRRGSTPVTARFSVADAKKAGLWGKDIWAKYPDRMLQNRARGFALRDTFPDLLRGLKTVEELRDTPPDNFRGTTLEAEPETKRIPDQPKATEPAAPPKRTYRDILDQTAGMLTACDSLDGVVAIADLPAVRYVLTNANPVVKNEMDALLAAAFDRLRAVADDAAEEEVFPGDLQTEPPTKGEGWNDEKQDALLALRKGDAMR